MVLSGRGSAANKKSANNPDPVSEASLSQNPRSVPVPTRLIRLYFSFPKKQPTPSPLFVPVPEKVWNLSDSEDCDKDAAAAAVRYDLDRTNEEDSWWNQKSLTTLDLSSNTLTSISENVKNLGDLTVLNVSI